MPQLTIQQAFELAVQHHQAGQLQAAEQIYRQILTRQPAHADALHLLGMIAHQTGNNDIAINLIRRSIALQPHSPDAHNNLGLILKATGQLPAAITILRQAVALRPNLADSLNNLGNALTDNKQHDEAIAAYQRAIAIAPDDFKVHNNLGRALAGMGEIDGAINAYSKSVAINPGCAEAHYNRANAMRDKGQPDQAIVGYRKAISLLPDYSAAMINLGNVLRAQGHLDDAIASFKQAILTKPNDAEAYSNLGAALRDKGQLNEAVVVCRKALSLRPKYPEASNNLGNALKDLGQFDQAIAVFEQALAEDPNDSVTHGNLGGVLKEMGLFDAALEHLQQAIALNPLLAEAYSNLGLVLAEKGRLDEALEAHHKAVGLMPESANVHANLGHAYKETGMLQQAIASFRNAIQLDPYHAAGYDNLLMTINYSLDCGAREIAAEQSRWNLTVAEPLRKKSEPFGNDRSVSRRLRVGYVSPDFRVHPVGRNILPLFREHDHQAVEIFCYAQVARPDGMTAKFRRLADGWRSTVGAYDDQLAVQIRSDKIDILVDLALHTTGNRLLVFARRPAPVQVTFAAYPASTGLASIDYRLSDPYLDPPGMDESIYSEQTVRLPDTFWCFDPLEDGDLPVNPLPALEAGFITLGCLNNFCKVNDGILALWAQVMQIVDHSRLLLLAYPGSHQAQTLDRFAEQGINPDRIAFAPPQSRRNYLQLYHRIDIGLDSFPYNGHTTSLDSFWMGVPVVTLAGPRSVSRAGWSQLSNLGLAELAGHTPEQFVQIAVRLANDLPRLAQMRGELRSRMEQSPLMDGSKFARNIESAFRQMWKAWCESPTLEV